MKGKQNLSMPRKRSGVTGRPRRFPVSLLFLWVLAFFLFQGLGFPAWSAPNPAISGKPESLTVVIDDNYPPYIFRDASGQLQGILKDTWTLWEARTGVHVNLTATDWNKAQQLMQAGKADVIDTIFFTEARNRIYDFSKPYADLEVPIFFHRSITGIVDARSLHGFTVGVKEGDACIDFLQKHQITTLKPYPSYELLVKAAGNGEVRVFCIDEPPAIHFLYRLGLEKEFRHSPPLFTGQFHWAVHKNNGPLKNLIEEGFRKISPEESQKIKDKWLGSSVEMQHLYRWASYAGYALLAIAALIGLLVFWNRTLRRRVLGKTKELTHALFALREANLQNEKARDQLAATLEAIPDLLFELDLEGRYYDYRAARPDFLVAPPPELLGHTVFEVMPRESATRVISALKEAEEKGTSHGTLLRLSVPAGELWFELSVARKKIVPGENQRFIVLSRNVSERIRAEAEIERLAFYDPLTHLPNRRLLIDRLKQAMAASLRRSTHGALLFIDLDDFKLLNDTKGHNTGDLLLKEIAQRLQICVRIEDTIARLGGDEFVVMLEDLSRNAKEAATQAELVGEKVLRTICRPCRLGEYDHHTTASIGISLFFGHEDSEDELLKRADSAMYRAKTAGRNTVRFFDPDIQATLEARATLESELRRTLDNRQLSLYFQPQVSSGRIFGAEALIRWLHPERGMISPAQFIPLAEETGFIVPIGQWVLETACAQLKLWEQNPLTRNLQLSINVSARQFRQADFVSRVLAVLDASGANPGLLKIELTESLVLDNVTDSIEKMYALKSRGVGFSIDDFGTGYSSLAYLKRLPLDQLKIDQSFVRDIATDQSDAVIVQTIIGMAHNLGFNVIAEGVETEAQKEFLEKNGCPSFQGFLFSRPVPLADFEALLASVR